MSALQKAINEPFKNRFLREAAPRKLNKEQAQEEQAEKEQIGEQLLETWARTEVGSRKLLEMAEKNRPKAINTAVLLENQDRYLREVCGLKEDTQISGDFQLTPLNVLKVARIGSANSNRGNIVKEVALITMRDILVLVDTIYGLPVRGATQGAVTYENVVVDYASSSQTYTFPAAAASSFAASGLSPAPFSKLKTLVFVNGKLVGSDDGNAKFNSIDSIFNGSSSTIEYTSGTLLLTFTSTLASTDVVSIEWSWDAEVESNYEQFGQANLKVRVLTFNPILQPLSYNYSAVSAQLFGSTGIGNMQETIVKRIGDMHAARKDHKMFRFARQVAKGQQPFTFNTSWADEGSDNDWNHVQRITETIGNIGTSIYSQLQRGGVNALVAGTRAVNYLAKHRKYESDFTQSRAQGSYLDGYLDKIPNYVCPYLPSQGLIDRDEILCVFKNPEEDGEPSIVYGTFLELSARLEFPELYVKGTIATLEDRILVQPAFLKLLTLTNVKG